ncbi:hypothetical protein ScPMuIL_005586 [Solemya velum]
MKSVFVCTVLATLLRVKLTNGCDFDAVSECASLLSQNTDVMQSDGLAAIPSSQQLTEICSVLDEFRACYKPNLPTCRMNPFFTLTFGTVERTVDYLCGDGFEVILKYESCWNRSDVINATKTCYNTQVRDIRHLERMMSRMKPTVLSQTFCRILTNAKLCMRSAVGDKCGAEAANVIETILKRTFVEVVTIMGCQSGHSKTYSLGQSQKDSKSSRSSSPGHHLQTGTAHIWIIVLLVLSLIYV